MGKTKLAVMTIVDAQKQLSPALIDSLTDTLRTRIAQGSRYIVIDKSRHAQALRQLVKDHKKQSYKNCYDSSCQIPLGRALSADTLLRTKLSRVGSKLVLNAELVDLAKEAVVGAAQASVKAGAGERRDDQLLAAVQGLASQLDSKGRVASAPAPAPSPSPSGSLEPSELSEGPGSEGPGFEGSEGSERPGSLTIEEEKAKKAEVSDRARRSARAQPRFAHRRQVQVSRSRALRVSYGLGLLGAGALSVVYGAAILFTKVPDSITAAEQASSVAALESAADEAAT
ncbi:MAG: hypothetical protein JRH20_25475, partial [Deltaproteobacteria bacterium]|nr:hypothetical protein [Deltaproteobacteria bacterium]